MKSISQILCVVSAFFIAPSLQMGLDCRSHCNARVVANLEATCQPYRSLLPRPQLYNYCVEYFRKGAWEGCDIYCEEDISNAENTIGALEVNACDSLRAMQREAKNTCHVAFRAGVDGAKTESAVLGITTQLETSLSGSDGKGSKKDSKSKSGSASTAGKDNRVKFTLNTQNNPKNDLDAARDEAHNAYIDAKGKLEL